MSVDFLRLLYMKQDQLLEQQQAYYARCLSEIEADGLSVQIYGRLKALDVLDNVPDFFRLALSQKYTNALGQNLCVKRNLQTICSAFEAAQIPAIPFKGVRLAELYFGGIGARPTSDLDLLIHEKDLATAIDCLMGLGFLPPERRNPLHFHCLMRPSTIRAQNQISIELHWNLTEQRTSRLNPELLWRDAVVNHPYSCIYDLSLQHTFYGLCLHGWNHRMDSLKYVFDIMHMIIEFGPQLDFPGLFKQARDDRTFRRVYSVLVYVYKLYSELNDIKPLPKPRSTNRVTPLRIGKEQLMLLDCWVYRLRVIKDRVWPPKDVALWHMRDEPTANSSNVYFRFYRRRIRTLLRAADVDKKRGDQYA